MSFPNRYKHYLFGFPISHSVTPQFHSCIFQGLGYPNTYELCEIKSIDDPKFKQLIHKDDFAGASVTMPLKVTSMPLLDKITPEAQKIGSINTIYLESHPDPEKAKDGKVILVGTNTDYLGIRNSLNAVLSTKTRPQGADAAFIIGGGGTTRAAVFALSSLNFSPIYLINRDQSETKSVIEQFPDLDLRTLTSPDEWTEIQAKSLCTGIGAIPDIPPSTEAEKNVYAIAQKIFTSCAEKHGKEACTMLEMAYKPRRTTMLQTAESFGWTVIGGIEAMLEQGFAQDRFWLRKPDNDSFDIPNVIEEKARVLIRTMDDIKPNGSS